MKIKLKITSFILALSVSVSAFVPMVFAADDAESMETENSVNMVEDDENIDNKAEESYNYVAGSLGGLAGASADDHSASIDFLTRLGIIETPDDKDYPVKPVTRGEFLALAMRMIGYNDALVSENKRRLFFDVDIDSEFAGYVSAAYDLGVISAADDGYFNVDMNITCTEAATMLLRILNYKYIAEQNGSYPMGYMMVAEKLDLFDNVRAGYNDGLSCGDADEMIFNALNTRKVTVVPVNVNVLNDPTEKTVLEYYYNIYKHEGVLTGNSVVSIPAGEGAGEDCISVGGKIFQIDEEYDGMYLGYNVSVYYEDDGNDKVFAMYPKKNTVTTLNCIDVEEYMPGTLKYSSGTKTVTVKLSPYASTVLNNTVFTLGANGMTVDDYGDYGTFVLIDNDRDGRYDVIIITNWSTMITSGVNAEDEKIYSKKNSLENIDLTEYTSYRIYDESMNRIPLSEIAENDLIEYKKSPSGDSIDIVRVRRLCDIKVVSKGQEDGYLYLTDDKNQRYRVSRDFYKYSSDAEILVGQSYTFALNRNDDIACVVKVLNSSLTYGYIVKSYLSNDTGEDRVVIKLFTLDEEMITLTAAEKVKIYNSGMQSLKAAALYPYVAKPQLIRFALDEQGFIKTVDLASEDKFSDGFRQVGVVDGGNNTLYNRYKTGSRTIGGQILIDDNTVAVGIPTEEYLNDVTEYFVSGSAYFAGDEYYPGAVGYSTDPNSVAAQIVIIPGRASTVNSANPPMLVTKIYDGVDYDGEVVKYVKGLMSGKETDYPVKNGLSLTYTTAAYGTIPVEEGDVIQFAVDNKGQISAVNILMDESERRCYGSTGSSAAMAGSAKQCYGTVYKKVDNCLFLNQDGLESSDIYVITSNTYVYEYDPDGARVQGSICSASDIVTSEYSNTSPSEVFISLRYSEPKVIVIYK